MVQRKDFCHVCHRFLVLIPTNSIVYFPHQHRLFISGCISSRDMFFVHWVLWFHRNESLSPRNGLSARPFEDHNRTLNHWNWSQRQRVLWSLDFKNNTFQIASYLTNETNESTRVTWRCFICLYWYIRAARCFNGDISHTNYGYARVWLLARSVCCFLFLCSSDNAFLAFYILYAGSAMTIVGQTPSFSTLFLDMCSVVAKEYVTSRELISHDTSWCWGRRLAASEIFPLTGTRGGSRRPPFNPKEVI